MAAISRYITGELVLVLLTVLLPSAVRAMWFSPNSSASNLPHKRGKDRAGVALPDAVQGASDIEGDWTYMRHDVIEISVKNTRVPLKRMAIAQKVPCIHIVHFHWA
jgi:hypothetical protein